MSRKLLGRRVGKENGICAGVQKLQMGGVGDPLAHERHAPLQRRGGKRDHGGLAARLAYGVRQIGGVIRDRYGRRLGHYESFRSRISRARPPSALPFVAFIT